MTIAEIQLLLIIGCVISVGCWAFRLDIRKAVVVFALGCAVGFLAQLAIGPGLNRYTPNISLYVGYVSAAVIFAWGTGLACIWGTHLWFCRILKRRPGLLLNLFSALPVILILEAIGSNIVVMKLHGYQRYSSLMPMLNAMHAPAWLYGYYLFIAIIFYTLLKSLSMHTEDWSRAPAVLTPGVARVHGVDIR